MGILNGAAFPRIGDQIGASILREGYRRKQNDGWNDSKKGFYCQSHFFFILHELMWCVQKDWLR
jgi:hypothetical protein